MAKVVKFDAEARAAMIRGVNILADTTIQINYEEILYINTHFNNNKL